MRWPQDQLLRHLGDRATLLTVGDEYSDTPVVSCLAAWARQVLAFIDVPPESGSEMIALEDYRGSMINREIIDDKLGELPGGVREEVERWLRDGPDAEFLRLTEPDDDRLLISADIWDVSEGKIWDSRVPLRGLARRALEHEARKCDATPDSDVT